MVACYGKFCHTHKKNPCNVNSLQIFYIKIRGLGGGEMAQLLKVVRGLRLEYPVTEKPKIFPNT